jgi:peptide chain release factor subunit 1
MRVEYVFFHATCSHCAAQFKDELLDSKLLDARLQTKVVEVVNIAYGMQAGLHQAMLATAETISNSHLRAEQESLQRFFGLIAHSDDPDRPLFCYGPDDTLLALEGGAVQQLLVWEGLPLYRHVLRGRATVGTTPAEQVLISANAEPTDEEMQQAELLGSELLVEYLMDRSQELGSQLILVSDKTSIGSQFARGFGGLGAFLRFPLEVVTQAEAQEAEEDEEEELTSRDMKDLADFV